MADKQQTTVDYVSTAQSLVVKAIKYIIEGLAVAVAAYFIPEKRRLAVGEVLMIGISAAATFAILDVYSPSVASGARSGAGFGIGFQTVGFNIPGMQ